MVPPIDTRQYPNVPKDDDGTILTTVPFLRQLYPNDNNDEQK